MLEALGITPRNFLAPALPLLAVVLLGALLGFPQSAAEPRLAGHDDASNDLGHFLLELAVGVVLPAGHPGLIGFSVDDERERGRAGQVRGGDVTPVLVHGAVLSGNANVPIDAHVADDSGGNDLTIAFIGTAAVTTPAQSHEDGIQDPQPALVDRGPEFGRVPRPVARLEFRSATLFLVEDLGQSVVKPLKISRHTYAAEPLELLLIELVEIFWHDG